MLTAFCKMFFLIALIVMIYSGAALVYFREAQYGLAMTIASIFALFFFWAIKMSQHE